MIGKTSTLRLLIPTTLFGGSRICGRRISSPTAWKSTANDLKRRLIRISTTFVILARGDLLDRIGLCDHLVRMAPKMKSQAINRLTRRAFVIRGSHDAVWLITHFRFETGSQSG